MTPEVIAALAGAIVGGGVAFLGQLLLDQRRANRRETQLAASIRAELIGGLHYLTANLTDSENLKSTDELPDKLRDFADQIEEAEKPLPPLLALAPGGLQFAVLNASADRIGELKGTLPEDLAQLNEALSSLRTTVARIEKIDVNEWMQAGHNPDTIASYQASTYRTLADSLETVLGQTAVLIERLEARYS